MSPLAPVADRWPMPPASCTALPPLSVRGSRTGQSGRRGTEAGPVRGLRRAERRKQILDAATQAFARSGFVTTSLDEVAAEAGITHVILYRRFDCKAGMYRAVRDHARTRLASTAAQG